MDLLAGMLGYSRAVGHFLWPVGRKMNPQSLMFIILSVAATQHCVEAGFDFQKEEMYAHHQSVLCLLCILQRIFTVFTFLFLFDKYANDNTLILMLSRNRLLIPLTSSRGWKLVFETVFLVDQSVFVAFPLYSLYMCLHHSCTCDASAQKSICNMLRRTNRNLLLLLSRWGEYFSSSSSSFLFLVAKWFSHQGLEQQTCSI